MMPMRMECRMSGRKEWEGSRSRPSRPTIVISTWETVSQASGEFQFPVPGTAKIRLGALRPHLDDQFSPRWVGDPTRDSDVRTEGESIGWTEEFTVPADGVLAAGYDVGLIYAPPPRITRPFRITRTEWTPDDTFRFLLQGPLGGTYQVETFQRGDHLHPGSRWVSRSCRPNLKPSYPHRTPLIPVRCFFAFDGCGEL